jgi:hypothetical protein
MLRGQEIHLSVFQPQNSPQERLQHIGIFPGKFSTSTVSSVQQAIDLDPQGRWIAILQNEDMLVQPDVIASNPSINSQSDCTLRIFKLNSAQQVCHWPLAASADHLLFASSRYILVCRRLPSSRDQPRSTELQLWNRRGQLYWSSTLSTQLQQAVQISSNRIFALTDEAEPMGLWIDLLPFKIQQIPLGIKADWIGETRWGYILASQTGSMIYLNRRGRIMAKATLPISSGAKVSAIATHIEANLLWVVVTELGGQNTLCTLDMTLHLPKVLLRL